MARSGGSAEVAVCALIIVSEILAPFVFRVFMDFQGQVAVFAAHACMGTGVTHASNVVLVRMVDYARIARNVLLAHMAIYGVGV